MSTPQTDFDFSVKRISGFGEVELIKSDSFDVAGSSPIKLRREEKEGYLFMYGNMYGIQDIEGYLKESDAQQIRKIIYNALILNNGENDFFEFSIFKKYEEFKFQIFKNNNSKCGLYNGFSFSECNQAGGNLQNHDAYKLMDYLDLSKNLKIF